jgi:hypothetical protein
VDRKVAVFPPPNDARLLVANLTLLTAPSNVPFLLMASVTAVTRLHVLSLSSMLTLYKRVVVLTGILPHRMMVLTSLILHMPVVLPRLPLDWMLVLDGLLPCLIMCHDVDHATHERHTRGVVASVAEATNGLTRDDESGLDEPIHSLVYLKLCEFGLILYFLPNQLESVAQ